jgi:hypothetical protein
MHVGMESMSMSWVLMWEHAITAEYLQHNLGTKSSGCLCHSQSSTLTSSIPVSASFHPLKHTQSSALPLTPLRVPTTKATYHNIENRIRRTSLWPQYLLLS